MDNLLKKLSLALNGVNYEDVDQRLKELNLQRQDRFAILFGASDDLLELRGALEDEFGAYNGFDHEEYAQNQNDVDYDILGFLNKNEIRAVWCPDATRSWLIKSNSYHRSESFDILENGEVFCTGLIIDLETTTKEFESEIKKIESQLDEYNTYYRKGAPKVSDEIYDALEARLKELCPDSGILNKVGAKVRSAKKSVKVTHATKMLSMDKVYTIEELLLWSKGRDLISLPKIDGSSCSLIYIEGELAMAKTRGDGCEGEDITEHVGYIDSIPKKLNRKISIEIRGELYCKKSQFLILGNEMVSLGLDAPSSERNIVAGLIGRKSNVFLCKYLDFFAYTMIEEGPFTNKEELDSLSELRNLDFSVPGYVHLLTQRSVYDEIQDLDLHRSNLDYLIDGIVFVINSVKEQVAMGFTSHHPKFKMAYKFKSEDKDAIIEDIKWQVSRNGVLTPVAVVKTVELAGANVSNVTLHNYGIVRDFNLKVGDTIKITRSGEVIPKFLSVVTSLNGGHSSPKQCPCCQSIVREEDIRLFCENPNCESRIKESILNYISVMNIEDINEKRVEELLSKKLITNIESLYDLTMEKLLMLDKVKEKSATKIHDNIQGSKGPKLTVFLVANGINSLGLSSCEKIIEAGHNTLEKFLSLTRADIITVDGFSDKSADTILASLELKKETILNLVKMGVVPQEVKLAVKTKSNITGKSFCITGTLSKPRKEIEDLIKSLGGSIVGSVSSKTNYLLTNDSDSGSAKAKKALDLGVIVISENEFQALTRG